MKTVAPIGFGPVHGCISAFGQRVQVEPILGVHRNADGRCDSELMPLHHHGRLGQLQQLTGYASCTGGIRIGQQDDELVAAQA